MILLLLKKAGRMASLGEQTCDRVDAPLDSGAEWIWPATSHPAMQVPPLFLEIPEAWLARWEVAPAPSGIFLPDRQTGQAEADGWG